LQALAPRLLALENSVKAMNGRAMTEQHCKRLAQGQRLLGIASPVARPVPIPLVAASLAAPAGSRADKLRPLRPPI